jgi:DNA-binding transcriptional MerR regulator
MAKMLILVETSSMTNNMGSDSTTAQTAQSELKERIKSIPHKMGFKIGEVAKYVGVKQYVLRYWETEFEALHPKKSNNGQRFYTRKDIEMALTIRKLLHEDRFSIEGARAVLKKMKSQKSQIQPILEGTTQAQVVEAHQPAAEVVVSKAAPMPTADQLQKAVMQRERELHQYWASSVDYLIEEIRQAKKRLADAF